MLEIKNLYVSVQEKEIIKGVSLTFESGKVHVLMGPNGSGKSTLAYAMMGHPKYKITKGTITLDGQDITHVKPEERAKLGLFLSFQNPVETGVNVGKLLKEAHLEKLSVLDFHKLLDTKMQILGLEKSLKSQISGLSGGEKKRSEMLQLLMLKPKYALLDETDSGLDVDGIKMIAKEVKEMKSMGVIVITHYNKFLDYLEPDMVSVMVAGRIVAQGKDLAKKIELEGFAWIK